MEEEPRREEAKSPRSQGDGRGLHCSRGVDPRGTGLEILLRASDPWKSESGRSLKVELIGCWDIERNMLCGGKRLGGWICCSVLGKSWTGPGWLWRGTIPSWRRSGTRSWAGCGGRRRRCGWGRWRRSTGGRPPAGGIPSDLNCLFYLQEPLIPSPMNSRISGAMSRPV